MNSQFVRVTQTFRYIVLKGLVCMHACIRSVFIKYVTGTGAEDVTVWRLLLWRITIQLLFALQLLLTGLFI
jgi:hypothetical protein